jgi:gliding motility-associated-like protein
MQRAARLLFWLLLMQSVPQTAAAQGFNFNSGPIPPCDTSTFPAAVSGIGWLIDPAGGYTGYSLDDLWINITTEHPWTLKITLTSPTGTTILLSAFNGAGGQNYTDTHFSGWTNITTSSAPFTGYFAPQDGNAISSVFAGENADGTWVLTVIDTACAGGMIGGGQQPDSSSVPGTFGGTGGGGMAFGYNDAWIPCYVDLSTTAYICTGETFDLQAYAEQGIGLGNVPVDYYGAEDGDPWGTISDPTSVGAGTYDFNYSGDFGGYYCTAEGTVVVLGVQPDPLGPDQVINSCDNGPVNLRALFPGLTGDAWTWNGLPISPYSAAAAVNPGLYRVIVQASSNCPDTAWVTLNMNSDLLGADETFSICPGTSTDLTLLYPNTGYTESWFLGGASIPAPTAATDSGTYVLVATSSGGCSDTATVNLDVLPAVNIGQDQTATLCSNAVLDLTGLFATTGLTTSWTLGGSPVALPEGITQPGSYQVAAFNTEGCTDTALVTVAMANPPQLGEDAAASICEGNTLDLASQFNTTGLTVAWTSAGVQVADPTAVGTPGAYLLVATNAAGCSDTAQVAVSVNPNPVVGADQSITACIGQNIDLGNLYATAPNAVSWTINDSPVVNPAAVTSGGVYVLTVTSAQGCSTTASVDLDFIPGPDLGPDIAATICADSMLDLAGSFNTNGLSASWHTLSQGIVTYTNSVSLPGTYQLVASNGACTDTALLVLTVNPVPMLGADRNFELCPWRTVNLVSLFPTAGLATTYTWNGQAVANPDSVHQAGSYAVTATNAYGCSTVAWALISNVDCLCEADFATDARCLQEPAHFTLLADSAVQAVQWDFDEAAPNSAALDPEVNFGAARDVLVKMQATLSCGTVTVEHMLHIQDCADSCRVWFPNSFTPDKDGKNDTWSWEGGCVPNPYLLTIFDRWGKVLFTTTDPSHGWDGTAGGFLIPPGVYVYQAKYLLPYQDEQEVRGAITLVR